MLTVFLVFSMSPVVNTDNQFAVVCVFGWHVFTEGRSGFILKNYFAPGFRFPYPFLNPSPQKKLKQNLHTLLPPLNGKLESKPCTVYLSYAHRYLAVK